MIFFVALGLLAWYFYRRENPAYFYLVLLSGLFLLFGILVPENLLRPLQRFWMALAILLGAIVSYIILSVIFFLVVTPIGLLAKLGNKDWLNLKNRNSMVSYWTKRQEEELDMKKSYLRQF